MIYNVTSDWVQIDYTSGTIQNNSHIFDVEISNSTSIGGGVLLHPLNKFTFADQIIYMRCVGNGQAEVRVVPFVLDGGGVIVSGGNSSISDNQSFNKDDLNFIFD